jgi:hypothetical protein
MAVEVVRHQVRPEDGEESHAGPPLVYYAHWRTRCMTGNSQVTFAICNPFVGDRSSGRSPAYKAPLTVIQSVVELGEKDGRNGRAPGRFAAYPSAPFGALSRCTPSPEGGRNHA